jgi:hypothetical protein
MSKKYPVTSSRWPVVSNQDKSREIREYRVEIGPPVTDYWPPTTDYRLLITDYWLPTTLFSIIYTLHEVQTPWINKLLSCLIKPAGRTMVGMCTVSRQVVWPHWLHLKCTWSCWWWWSPWWHSSLHKAYFTPPLSSNTLCNNPDERKVLSVR